jgi:hypothetical protein
MKARAGSSLQPAVKLRSVAVAAFTQCDSGCRIPPTKIGETASLWRSGEPLPYRVNRDAIGVGRSLSRLPHTFFPT